MILISQALDFNLHKSVDAFTRSFLVQGTNLNIYSVDDISRVLPIRISKESRLKIKKVWPLFVQAEGIRPAGTLTATPASMSITINYSNTSILINDWKKGIENLNLLLEPPSTPAPYFELKLLNFSFVYDGLNMQDVYNNTSAKAYILLDVDAVPYV